jgi:hypothetical protein
LVLLDVRQTTSEASAFNNRRASLNIDGITTTLQQLKDSYRTTGKTKLAAVEEASERQEALQVVANGFTVQTIYSLRTAFEELGKLLDARLDSHLAVRALCLFTAHKGGGMTASCRGGLCWVNREGSD